MAFVRSANPIWFMVDLVGLPLNDEYYMHFLQNTIPYLPQNVYHTPSGTEWDNPLQFSPAGTLPDNLYFDPTLVYRLEVRRGQLQTDPLIWEINDYLPDDGSSPSPDTVSIASANQITNPQFAEINFVSPLSITAAGTYDIAPGWKLELTGSSTCTITRIDNISGDELIINNPAYGLQFALGAWTEAKLYQRFNKNGSLWASTPDQDGAVTMSVTCRANDGVARTLNLIYEPNSPGTPETIASDTTSTAGYAVIAGALVLSESTNSTVSDDAYVDMVIDLPVNGTTDITCVQCIGQEIALTLPYEQETPERQKDHLFHYYANELIVKPKKSILTGWNFSLNPFQFYPIALTATASASQYICDQTIIYQLGAGQVETGQADATNRYGLEIKAINTETANRFAIIQYIDPKTALPYWGQILSSLVRARIFTTHGTSIPLKCRLIASASLPLQLSATQPISSWLVGTDPTFDAQWTVIEPLNDPAYILENSYDTEQGANAYPSMAFNQFTLPACTTDEMTLGIVLYTMDDMDETLGTEDSIVFDKVSLMPSLFASDAEPQTADQVLRECQYYYEKSYNYNVEVGTATGEGANFAVQNTSSILLPAPKVRLHANSFVASWKTEKRDDTPDVVFYSIAGTIDNVSGVILNNGGASGGADIADTNWTSVYTSRNNAYYTGNTIATLVELDQTADILSSYLLYHYTADARLAR